MVPLYTAFVAALGGLRWLLAGRAARTERKFAQAARAAEQAARLAQTRPGNASAADPLAAAKRQYELGRLVEVRDALEAKYVAWQAAADRTGKLVVRLRDWKGRTVPYLFGVADAAIVLAVMHAAGVFPGFDVSAAREWAANVKW